MIIMRKEEDLLSSRSRVRFLVLRDTSSELDAQELIKLGFLLIVVGTVLMTQRIDNMLTFIENQAQLSIS